MSEKVDEFKQAAPKKSSAQSREEFQQDITPASSIKLRFNITILELQDKKKIAVLKDEGQRIPPDIDLVFP